MAFRREELVVSNVVEKEEDGSPAVVVLSSSEWGSLDAIAARSCLFEMSRPIGGVKLAR